MPPHRPRQTCTECSLRRQKCDRKTPCGRCTKRGIAEKCTTSWPEPYNPQIHRAYPRTRPRKSQTTARVSSSLRSTCEVTQKTGVQSSSRNLREDKTVLRNWQICNSNQSKKSWSGTGPKFPVTPHESFLQTLIPGTDLIWNLVDYHEVYLLWYHGCYHGPTLRFELQSAIDENKEGIGNLAIGKLNLQWLALLFAIMAGSVTCATDARLDEWGISKKETKSLSEQWYKATITCLNEAGYTSNPEIYSIHAIATLSMSAHPLGHSQELSVLLGAAVKISQALGLNRLDHDSALENISRSSPESQRQKLLKREIGRRLWSFLCVYDWMSLPFTEAYIINPLHFTTIKPSSRNHITMDPVPASFPTYISYGNYLYEIAKLMLSHHDAMLRAKTEFTSYETVMDYDTKIRTLAIKGIPRYFHVVEPIDPAWPPWVIWARKSLTICFAHKIIMIHRAFIRQSFTNVTYKATRITCLAASKTILKEAKRTQGLEGPLIWIDKAFCVAAGIILCLDIFHRSESDFEFQTHRSLVISCISLLQKFDNSVVAVRGAVLLSALIDARDLLALRASRSPQSVNIVDALESLAAVRESLYHAFEIDQSSATELFPQQAGFSNRVLFNNLLC
ncbi:hypothetical protein F1880_003403 [Penicillium rolfsii]|nr:hypothetical protein F1880_003403 [Penicillium rolfsii]